MSEMSENEKTAERLCRDYAADLHRMAKYGATFTLQMLTMTRIEVQFSDGERVVVSFTTPKRHPSIT